ILQLISQGEGEKLDFKREISNSSRIARTIVSFANHKGGTLLVGVNDDGTIAGVKVEEEKFMLEQAAVFFCRPEVELIINEWPLKKKIILEVIIPVTDKKPYYAKDEEGKWLVHIRVGDKSLLASKVVVDVLKRGSQQKQSAVEFSSKEKALFDYLRSNEKITVKQYCKLINISRWRAIKILVNLITLGIIRSHTTEKTEFYTLS
ncbi:MAG: ATP-binding protein, partial [Bacteroidota bacterium]